MKRALTIGLAVLLAILGTTGVLVYVSHANARALNGQRAVNVLVAKSLIPAGTSAANAQGQGLLTTERLPASSVPVDAVVSVTPDISALVTDADVQAGQLLVRPMLVTAAQATNGLAVPQGMVAVSIQFCLPEAVAGYIHPGSQVAVFDTTGSSSMNAQPGCNGQHAWQSGNSISTKLMMSKVTVLAVGQASTSQNGSTNGGSVDLITLAVDTHDAAELILMSEHDMPYLALMASS